jgi:hypothetical protein
MSFARNTGGGGKHWNKYKTKQKYCEWWYLTNMRLWDFTQGKIWGWQKYMRVQEYEVWDIKYAVWGYEVMKTLKSLIKDEGDLNQNDMRWTELLFWGGIYRVFIPKYHVKLNKETTKKSEQGKR